MDSAGNQEDKGCDGSQGTNDRESSRSARGFQHGSRQEQPGREPDGSGEQLRDRVQEGVQCDQHGHVGPGDRPPPSDKPTSGGDDAQAPASDPQPTAEHRCEQDERGGSHSRCGEGNPGRQVVGGREARAVDPDRCERAGDQRSCEGASIRSRRARGTTAVSAD